MQHVPDTASFRLTHTDEPPGLAIRGDLGPEHTARFARALRCAAADGDGNVYLDCEGLDTVSVEGLRAMMDAAAENPMSVSRGKKRKSAGGSVGGTPKKPRGRATKNGYARRSASLSSLEEDPDGDFNG